VVKANLRQPVRLWGGLLSLLSIVALAPASLLALGGMMWLGAPDLDWPNVIAAAAVAFIGPLALGLGALFGWQAAQDGRRRDLIRGTVAAIFAAVIYAGAWSFGG
jgi:hypothetical protein